MEWRPVETAPKDGQQILLCQATNSKGEPLSTLSFALFVQVASWWGDKAGWMVYCDLVQDPQLHFEPTHWAPIPTPPVVKEDL